MSWRELAWHGRVRPRDPSTAAEGFATSIGVSTSSASSTAAAPGPTLPRGRLALDDTPAPAAAGGGETGGLAVQLERIGPRADGPQVTRAGRMRIPR
jgi:hypothetical protein